MMILSELLPLLIHLAKYLAYAFLEVPLVPEQPLVYLLLHLRLCVPLILNVTHSLDLRVLLPRQLSHQHLSRAV